MMNEVTPFRVLYSLTLPPLEVTWYCSLCSSESDGETISCSILGPARICIVFSTDKQCNRQSQRRARSRTNTRAAAARTPNRRTVRFAVFARHRRRRQRGSRGQAHAHRSYKPRRCSAARGRCCCGGTPQVSSWQLRRQCTRFARSFRRRARLLRAGAQNAKGSTYQRSEDGKPAHKRSCQRSRSYPLVEVAVCG
jgi:hypothetical protein